MRLMPYIKKGLIIFIKDIHVMVITFLILPMALALIYGNMQRDLFEGKNTSIETLKVDFQYDKSSEKGRILNEILSDDGVKEIIQDDDNEKEYSVIISDDFKDVEIRGKDQESMQFILLKNFVSAIISNFNQFDVVQSTISNLNLSQFQKNEIMNSVMDVFNKYGSQTQVREKIIEGYRTLDSFNYYTISMFSFTSMFMVVMLASYYYKEIREGIVRRSLSTPCSKRNYYLGFMVSTFLISLILSVVYIVINRIRGTGFLENPFHIGIIILLQSILCASTVGVVITFIKKEMTATVIMNLVLVIPSIFGGAFFNIGIIDNKIIQRIINLAPNTLILNSFKDLAVTGSIGAIRGELTAMLLLSTVFILLTMFKTRSTWEV